MFRMLTLLLLTTLANGAKADCTCRFSDGIVEQGQTACIPTAKGKSLARCEMNLNVASWTVLDQPCPQVSTLRSRQRTDDFLETRLIDTARRFLN